ncbi:MAG: hypothetical protein M1821_009044 [Bathelium mastoideum]|nr:MAG: hypothetical protein M1821_009044 [Bathelium mastoideum]
MLPQMVCNLLDTLSKPPWAKPLNWDLHMTVDGEEVIPFHLHVQHDAIEPTFPFQISSFPQFNKLPPELQLRVLSFCSACTLFQVMRVSSTLRIEAAKLFWADPNTYYLVESYWLLGGGHPGDTGYDLPFLAHVQNIEVEYCDGADDKIGPLRDSIMDIQHDVVRDFWKTLKKRFPSVKKVVINQNWEPTSSRQHDKPVPRCNQILIESCPPEIDVFAFVLEQADSLANNSAVTSSATKWQRSLYQPTAAGEWRKLTSSFDHTTILMPMKQFRGPVGEFQELRFAGKRLQLQRNAIGPLVLESIDRDHFDEGKSEPFPCPVARCDAHFERAGQWTIHAAEMHSDDLNRGETFDILSRKSRGFFQLRITMLNRKQTELNKKRRRIFEEWNDKGGKKRKELESAWIDQLENDDEWDTGREARESELWKEFSMVMDPTWCGQ